MLRSHERASEDDTLSDVTDAGLGPDRPWVAGELVGRYALLAPLARGGMAELWLARHTGPQSFEKLVVVKRILAQMEGADSLVEMFLDEARIVAQLNHPNIVQVSELGEQQGSYFIAMEYLHGESLAHLVRAVHADGSVMPVAIAVRIIAEAAEGLGHAHTRRDLNGKALNIVHRDVSPQNLMVTYDGIVKVLDFGIAKATGRTTHTETGMMKGKLQYMAPEQARAKREITASADVFALGVMLFELLTGTRLYGDSTDIEILARLISGEPFPRPRDRLSTVDPRLDRITARAMSLDPGQRHQDGRELASELSDWLHDQRNSSTALDLEALLKTVLAERLKTRQALIQKAIAGPPVNAVELTPGSRASIPGGTPFQPNQGATVHFSAPKRRSKGVWFALLAALGMVAVTAGIVVTRVLSAKPKPQPVVVLAPVVVPPAPAPTPEPIRPEPAPNPVAVVDPAPAEPVAPAPVPSPEPTNVPPKAPAPVQAKKGLLRLDTQPWTEVFLGNKSLGDTPLLDVALPAGTHMLRLKNEQDHVDRRIEVEIKTGETTTLRLTL